MYIKRHKECRACYSHALEKVLDFGKMYLPNAFDTPGKRNNLICWRKVPSSFLLCKDCGLLQSEYSVDPNILYANYHYKSSVSATMREHLNGIVKDALKYYRGGEKKLKVLDIAANDLTLLRNYPDNFIKVGVDPSDIARKAAPGSGCILINKCFPCELPYKKFDIITSIAMFYDVNDPNTFVYNIQKILNKNGIWVLELAYLPLIVQNMCYDGFVTEHVTAYTLGSFERILEDTELRVFNVQTTDTNGGSIKIFVCHKDSKYTEESKVNLIRANEFDKKYDLVSTYNDFFKRVKEHRFKLKSLLWFLKRVRRKTIHAYGASTKLNHLISFCGLDKYITGAVERDTDKVGGSTLHNIPIFNENNLDADIYVVGPYHFKKEILKREHDRIKAGKVFIFPLPKIEVVTAANYEEHLNA